MSLEEPTETELREAIHFIRELKSDPEKRREWADKVIEGWLKRRSKISLKYLKKG